MVFNNKQTVGNGIYKGTVVRNKKNRSLVFAKNTLQGFHRAHIKIIGGSSKSRTLASETKSFAKDTFTLSPPLRHPPFYLHHHFLLTAVPVLFLPQSDSGHCPSSHFPVRTCHSRDFQSLDESTRSLLWALYICSYQFFQKSGLKECFSLFRFRPTEQFWNRSIF